MLTFATNTTLAVVNITTGILAARLLGVAGRGELAALQLWPMVFASLAALGMPEALAYLSAKRPELTGPYTGTAVFLSGLASLVLFVATYPLIPLLLSQHSSGTVQAAQIYLSILPLWTLGGLPFHVLRGQNHFAAWNALRLLAPLGWLIVIVLSYLTERTSAQELATSYLAIYVLILIPVWSSTSRRVTGSFRPDRSLSTPLLRFGLPTLATTAPQLLNLRLDQLLIAAFLDARQLGLYVVAVTWSGAILPAMQAFSAVIMPRIAKEREQDAQIQLASTIVALGFVLSAVGAIAAAVLSPIFVPLLFGDAFRDAIPVAALLSGAVGALAFGSITTEVLRGMGHPLPVMWAELAALVVAAVALAILLPVHGIRGAAVATALSYTTGAGFMVANLRRRLGLEARQLLLVGRNDIHQAWVRLTRGLWR